MYKIINGDNITELKKYPDNTFDSVVTDPPYLIDFLGKDWDKHMDQTELWKECLRVLKPGGHLVAFSASRTYHKIAMFIDVAGFEIRDQLMWVFSSGFPKAQSIGKAIQRRQGVKEIEGYARAPKTTLAKQWLGWKGALKPAQETIVLARKSLGVERTLLNTVVDETNNLLGVLQCQFAKTVTKSSNHSDPQLENTVPINVQDNLKSLKSNAQNVKTDISISQEIDSILLNIDMLWNNIWEENSDQVSTYTTKMALKMITEFQTLKLWILENTVAIITQEKKSQNEQMLNVLSVVTLLQNSLKKLNDIQTEYTVQENATLKTHTTSQEETDEKHRPIVLARKPFKGSCIDNVLKHGTGALNIDACRIDYKAGEETHHQNIRKGQANATNNTMPFCNTQTKVDEIKLQGRYPSNVIGEIPEKQECFFKPEYDKNYMYQPKVSRKERHIGHDNNSLGPNINANTHGKTPYCDDCNKTFNGTNNHTKCDPELKTFKEHRDQTAPAGNNHPTVKPVALMSWLVKLITPSGGKVLDPFNGSGSTGMACIEHGFDYTGIELDLEYCEISEKRIAGWEEHCNKPKDLNGKEIEEKTRFNDLFE